MYDCEICSERIKRNFSSISGHLAVKHGGMTVPEYERKFGLGDYEVEVEADVAVAEIVRMRMPGTSQKSVLLEKACTLYLKFADILGSMI